MNRALDLHPVMLCANYVAVARQPRLYWLGWEGELDEFAERTPGELYGKVCFPWGEFERKLAQASGPLLP